MQRGIDENYRRAAMVLAHAARESRYSSVLFSAARHGEGVTTTVVRVARELRSTFGLRPLVVETNWRRPRMAELLSLQGTGTFQSVASGRTPISDAVRTDGSGVGILVCGPEPPDNSQGLAGALRRVVDDARTAGFDFVLVDTEPVLQEPDAVAAGSAVARMLLVVESGKTTDEMLERVKRRLETENIALVGALLNKDRKYMPRWLYDWIAHTDSSQ